MGSALDDGERVQPGSLAEWSAWLEQHHARPQGVWLVGGRNHAGRAVPYDAAVEEALCWGWIDGVSRPLDDERSMQWFAPRRRGSVWAASNRERVERLEREGRMTPAGRAAVERARADGTWDLLVPAERLEVPDDLAAALDAAPGTRARWDASPPSSRTMALGHLLLAKRPATRESRIVAIVERLARGERPAG